MAAPRLERQPGGMGGIRTIRPPTRRDVEMHLGRYTFHNRNWVACMTYGCFVELEGMERVSVAYSLTEMDSVVISVAFRHVRASGEDRGKTNLIV